LKQKNGKIDLTSIKLRKSDDIEDFKINLTALLSNKAEEVETAISSYRASNNMTHVNINEGEYPHRGGSS